MYINHTIKILITLSTLALIKKGLDTPVKEKVMLLGIGYNVSSAAAVPLSSCILIEYQCCTV